jgi:hypothetical protein
MLPLTLAPAGLVSASWQEETARVPAKPAGQEDVPGAQEVEPAETPSGPKDITERVAIYVFLGWLWLSILVLIYALRLKIRESDRLNNFAFFDTDNTTPSSEI